MAKQLTASKKVMNNNPLVSILLPNLNTRPFLEERMDTILNQTYNNWELIIADSYSDDGSWEYLSQFPEKDSRITAYQIPKGLYQAWNFCIEKAKGEYIYIATSDDTMVPECIEKMVSALEAHPECDICDSKVMVINEHSQEITESDASYPIKRTFFKRFGETSCIRLAPYDFFEQLNGETIYISITQIMIRRKLFGKTGLFPEDIGHIGDFIWGVRAGRYANVIYLPEKLGTWRIHSKQASGKSSAPEYVIKASKMVLGMARSVFAEQTYKGITLSKDLQKKLVNILYLRFFVLNYSCSKFPDRFLSILRYIIRSPVDSLYLFFVHTLRGDKDITGKRIERILSKIGINKFLIQLDRYLHAEKE